MRRSSFLAAVIAGLVAPACDDPRLGHREQAIINGTPAPSDVAVMGLAYHQSSCGQDISYIDCSGTLIAPRVVVTAAHCFGFDPPNVHHVFFGTSFAAGGTLIPVVGGRVHPDYDATTHANDIAALILESDAPSSIAPIPLRRTPLPDITGTTVRMIGFGLTDIMATQTGDRMSGTGRVTVVGTDDITMEPAPAMSCHADSGGPVLADLGAGEELVGVTSYGDAACALTGVAIRVDRQLAFLDAILAEAAASPPRRAFDPNERFCATTCERDDDCPAGTVCFSLDDQPRHCVYQGLPAGEFGKTCTMSAGETPCVTMPDGSCRQYVSCDQVPPDSCCSAGRSGAGVGSGVVAALALLAMRRRRRPETSKDRRSPDRRPFVHTGVSG